MALLVLGILALHPASMAHALRVCMLPSELPVPEGDERRSDLESRLIARFERAKVAVTGPTEVARILKEVEGRSGAIFDPATGRIDELKQAAYDADVDRSVRDQLDCKWFVRLSVQQVVARYFDNKAQWDGRRVAINSGHRRRLQAFGRGAIIVLGAIGGVLIIPGREAGWVPALTLSVHVTDLDGDDVAFRSAGIHPLLSLSVSRGQDLLPEDQWLRNPAEIETAIDLALGDDLALLRTAGRPGGTSEGLDLDWE